MLIFLDSNILCSNYKMRGPSFEVVKKVGNIVLGQIVVDEVCNQYKKNLEDRAKKAQKAIQDLNDMLFTPHIVWNEIDVANVCSRYEVFLEDLIFENGMIGAEDYPGTEHRIIVERALQRKKPFKEDGSTGYRDYLVWETCLSVAQKNPDEEIHFISNNTRDFADSNDKEKLHPDLLADLAERNIPETRFFYWNSLKSFIDNYARKKLDTIEAHETTIAEIETNETGFIIPVQKFISNKVVGCSLSGFDVLVPGDNMILKELESDGNPEIEDLTELEDNLLLLSITIECFGVVASNIYEDDIKEVEEFELDVVVVGQSDGGICDLETTLRLRVQLRAVYSKNTNTITSIELDDIDDYNCPYCPY